MTPVLLAAALAKKPEPVAAPDADAIAREEKVACSADVPEGYQVTTGYGGGADSAEAFLAAQADARNKMLESVCAGKERVRCEAVSRHLEPWKQPFWNPIDKRACAHVAVNRNYIDDDRGDVQRLAAEIRRLAGEVARVAPPGRPIWVAPVLWAETGCDAGGPGGALVAELRNGLAGAEIQLARSSEAAPVLQVDFAPRDADLVVSAVLSVPGEAGDRPLQGFSIPADVFGEVRVADCRADRELGLVNGKDVGADGRAVALRVPPQETWCEGDAMTPSIVVDRPSRVRVFSVAPSGDGYLVWPPPGEAGLVDATASLGELILSRLPEGGDEKLVAVALAPDAPMGRMATWQAFCKAPGVLDHTAWPDAAAAGAATFRIEPASAVACARRGVVAPLVPALPPAVPACR